MVVFSDKIVRVIEHSKDLPDLKEEIKNAWLNLVKEGALEVEGTDREIRPIFVALQGIVEDVMSREFATLKGYIHTPMPATPLCTKGEISKDLVDPTIEKDPKRLFTVKARTTIVRDFLQRGGDLYIIYPKDGLFKRTEEQRAIYKQELLNHPLHLIDQPLACSAIPDALIGATYLFTSPSGQRFAFAIMITQAKDPLEIGHFGLWFGPLNNLKVSKRINAVFNFLKEKGSETNPTS